MFIFSPTRIQKTGEIKIYFLIRLGWEFADLSRRNDIRSYQLVCIGNSLYHENEFDRLCEATIYTRREFSCQTVLDGPHEVSWIGLMKFSVHVQ